MSETEKYKIAKEYVDQKIKKMKQAGLKVRKTSPRQYQAIVKQVAKTVKG